MSQKSSPPSPSLPQIPASGEITPEIDEEDVLTAVLLEGIWAADEAGLFAKRSSFPGAAKKIAESVMAWIGKMDAADAAGETHLFQGIELLNGSGILTCLLCGEPEGHASHS